MLGVEEVLQQPGPHIDRNRLNPIGHSWTVVDPLDASQSFATSLRPGGCRRLARSVGQRPCARDPPGGEGKWAGKRNSVAVSSVSLPPRDKWCACTTNQNGPTAHSNAVFACFRRKNAFTRATNSPIRKGLVM